MHFSKYQTQQLQDIVNRGKVVLIKRNSIHLDVDGEEYEISGLRDIPNHILYSEIAPTITYCQGKIVLTLYPVISIDNMWIQEVEQQPEPKSDKVTIEIPRSLVTQLLYDVSHDDMSLAGETWQSSEQQILEEIVKDQLNEKPPMDDFEGDTIRCLQLQSHPQSRRKVFWDPAWSPVMFERSPMVKPTDEDLFELVKELDRRFVQLWDKIKYEGADPTAVPTVYKLVEALQLAGVKDVASEVDSLLSLTLHDYTMDGLDWHDLRYMDIQWVHNGDAEGTLDRLIKHFKGELGD